MGEHDDYSLPSICLAAATCPPLSLLLPKRYKNHLAPTNFWHGMEESWPVVSFSEINLSELLLLVGGYHQIYIERLLSRKDRIKAGNKKINVEGMKLWPDAVDAPSN